MHPRADEIVAMAKTFVGTKYRHQGRSEHGLDCGGLMFRILNLLEFSDFDTFNYSRRPNVQEFTNAMKAGGFKRIPMTDLSNGDVLRMSVSGWPVHVAIYEVDEHCKEWYIHSYLPHRKVTRNPLTPGARQLISSVWRYPE